MRDSSTRLSIAYLGDPNSVHVRRWASYFAGLGHRVTLLVPEALEIAPGLPAGIETARFLPFFHRRSRLAGMVDARRSLKRQLEAVAADVLHAHHVTGNAWHAWMSGFHPYVVTVWGTDVLVTARSSRLGGLYARRSLRAADAVTGGSNELVRAAIAAGARADRTHYVHFGVDTDRFSPGTGSELRARLGLGDARVVLSPRIIAPNYNQNVVLDALPRMPSDTVLLMTDFMARDDELAALRARAGEIGMGERLRVVPSVSEDELPDLYRLANVVVSVPTSDGGPSTVVETLASGRPIVASDLAANREWLSDLDPAALVPVGDAAATAAAVTEVLGRPAKESAERAARGRAEVEARAGRRASMAVMESLYIALARRGTAK